MNPELEKARQLVLAHGASATAYQILNPGFRRWFAVDGDAVAGYVDAAGTWVVAGVPICSAERLPTVLEELAAAARRSRRRLCFFGVEGFLAASFGGRLLLGAQPEWHPASWEGILATKASLRAQL